jgi:UDP-GlcNAc:undecaprenyl-phosphate/decaprenyl-phosphate GlcNAc-1-phosphate transferase
MKDIIDLFFLPFLVAALVSYSSVPLVIKYAQKLGIIDDPKKHKHVSVIHKYPTPRGGGAPLFLGIAVSSLIFLPFDKHLAGILFGGLVLVILGILDDKYNLNPYKRLFIQFFVAAIPIAAGIGIAFIRFPALAEFINNNPNLHKLILTDPETGIIDLSEPKIFFDFFGQHSIWILSDFFALFWIVILMNFVNIGASGLDGQLSGTIVIAATTISALALRYSADITQWPAIILAATTAGAFFGFLPWHAYPQKIMPGFGGSTLAGFMLGILSILTTAKVGTLLLVLAVPLIDTLYVIVRRMSQGKAPLWGDRGHLHHRLLDAGLTKRQVAFVYWASTALLGIIALNLNAQDKLYTIIGVTIIIGGIILWLTKKKNDD